MNQLIYAKEKEMAVFCERKNIELSTKYPESYFWNFTRAGKQWNYYMAIRVRSMFKLLDMINEENK